MNNIVAHEILNPHGETDQCAKLTIDDVSTPFVLHNIVEVGKSYTFSFWIRAEAEGTISIYGNDIEVTSGWNKYTASFVAANTNFAIQFLIAGTYYIYQPKLEEGNSATSWMLAPEDMVSKGTLSDVEASLLMTMGGILSRVEDAEGHITEVIQTADRLTVRLNDVSVGGRNLIAGTSLETVYSGNRGTSSWKDVWQQPTISPPRGEEYVVSFEAKADVAQDITCFFYSPSNTKSSESSTGQKGTGADGNCSVSITTEWKRYWVKWKQNAADTVKKVIVGRNYSDKNIYIRAVKLEEGNMPTSWSPAPEDLSRTATDYLRFDSEGLVIGDMTSSGLGSNTLIYPEGVAIRNNKTVLASFEDDLIRLGIGSDESKIKLCNDLITILGYAWGEEEYYGCIIKSDKIRLSTHAPGDSGEIYAPRIALYPAGIDLRVPDPNIPYGESLIDMDETKIEFVVPYHSNSAGGSEGVVLATTDTSAAAFFRPTITDKIGLGSTSTSWYKIWTKNAVEVTSDRRKKENIMPLSTPELASLYAALFDKLEPVEYNLIDGPEEKSFGLIAQDVVQAMSEVGLPETALDLVHHNFWTDEETGEEKDSYGIVYENLIALLIYEVQKLKEKVKSYES